MRSPAGRQSIWTYVVSIQRYKRCVQYAVWFVWFSKFEFIAVEVFGPSSNPNIIAVSLSLLPTIGAKRVLSVERIKRYKHTLNRTSPPTWCSYYIIAGVRHFLLKHQV